jgi:hypothetical protein
MCRHLRRYLLLNDKRAMYVGLYFSSSIIIKLHACKLRRHNNSNAVRVPKTLQPGGDLNRESQVLEVETMTTTYIGTHAG